MKKKPGGEVVTEKFVFTPEKINEMRDKDSPLGMWHGRRIIMSNQSKLIAEIFDVWDEFNPEYEGLKVHLILLYPSDYYVVTLIVDKIGDKNGRLFKEPIRVVNAKFTNIKRGRYVTVIEFIWSQGDNDVGINSYRWISVTNSKNRSVYGLYKITLDCNIKLYDDVKIMKRYGKPELAGKWYHEILVFDRKKVTDYLIRTRKRAELRREFGYYIKEDDKYFK